MNINGSIGIKIGKWKPLNILCNFKGIKVFIQIVIAFLIKFYDVIIPLRIIWDNDQIRDAISIKIDVRCEVFTYQIEVSAWFTYIFLPRVAHLIKEYLFSFPVYLGSYWIMLRFVSKNAKNPKSP